MNKFSTSIFITILGATLLLPGCKKPAKPIVAYEVTMNKNGTLERLIPNYCSIRPNVSMPGKTEFTLTTVSADFKVTFAISVQVTGNLTTGVYKTTDANCSVVSDYFKNQGQPEERDFTIDNAPGQPPGYFIVSISSIDDKEIKGAFSCNYLYDRPNNESITITDGMFAAKRHQ